MIFRTIPRTICTLPRTSRTIPRTICTNSSLINKTGADIIYNKLVENNVSDVFMYSGGAIMPLIDKFYNNNINYYINTHEQNCVHAATGYAKSSNKPGIVITTSGPGLTNSITGMLDATNDSTPLIVISGQVPLNAMGTQAFQECPAIEITKPVTKWSYCITDINEVNDVFTKAFDIAQHGKKGTVHIDVPKCILNESIFTINHNYISENKKIKKIYPFSFYYLAALINQTKNPVIFVGQGCQHASQELRKLAYVGNIPNAPSGTLFSPSFPCITVFPPLAGL